MHRAERWQGRAATLEAIALLAIARLLVAYVPLARWRLTLGDAATAEPGDPQLVLPDNLAARRLARAVERAAGRLGGESRCLPRAMALQWMLRRRRMGGTLVIGLFPEHRRGGLDDLHAWVVRGGEVMIGRMEHLPHPIYAATV